MNDRTPCVDHEALVTYLYDECAPTERESIATHLAICASCAEEVQALGDTRAHLASWSPPALPLGFQITRTESDQPAKVVTFASRSSQSGGWWRQPLPAWAQVAAAVAIFAAGMSASALRSSGDQPVRVAQAPATQGMAATAAAQADDLRVTRAEFARLDARLRAMESADVSRASYDPRTADVLDDNDLHVQFSSLANRVAASERQNLDNFAKLARALDANRRDTDAIREATEKINSMDEELQDHRQVLRTAVVPGLAVRTALTSGAR